MARGRKKENNRKEIKRGNGTGSVQKLSGNRRRPWTAVITVGAVKNDDNSYFLKRKNIGYYVTREEAIVALAQYVSSPYELHSDYKFSDVYDMWTTKYFKTLESPTSIRTIVSAYNHCKLLWMRKFTSISIQDMRDAIDQPDNTPNTKSRVKSMLNLMYDFAVEAEIVPVNKARQFSLKGNEKEKKKAKKDKIPIKPEHIKLLEKNPEAFCNRLILIGLYSGLRPSEICELERANIHLDENYMIGGMKTEAGTDRYVPIHPNIRSIIEYYYNKTTEDDKYLIKVDDGLNCSYMTYDMYRGRFKKAMNAINADGLYTPHCTRHTFITNGKAKDMDISALKMIVGHDITDVTEAVYTHREPEFLQKEILKIKYD